MSLGVLYFALTCISLVLWGMTNHPSQPLNLWRFWLVGVSAIGALVCLKASFVTYAVIFAVLSIFVAWHFAFSYSAGAEFCSKFYMVITYVTALLSYALSAFSAVSMRPIAALCFVVPGLLATYTKPGKRLTSWLLAAPQDADY